MSKSNRCLCIAKILILSTRNVDEVLHWCYIVVSLLFLGDDFIVRMMNFLFASVS